MKTVTIYTDGACSGNPGPGGWGAILEWNGVEKELSGGEKQTTNNRMELTGVICALGRLREPCRVELYTDSKYVCDAVMKRWVYGWKAKGWVKRNGKKIAIGAVGVVGLGLGYALGKNSSADSEDSNEETEDNTVEVDYHDYTTGGEE